MCAIKILGNKEVYKISSKSPSHQTFVKVNTMKTVGVWGRDVCMFCKNRIILQNVLQLAFFKM